MLRTTCPECGEPVEFDEDARVGERVRCVECRVDLEILSLSPLVDELPFSRDRRWLACERYKYLLNQA
jgi:lysine biosynthesis protein LysW